MPSIRRSNKITAKRIVTVLRRYFVKVAYRNEETGYSVNPGDIVLVVRNDKGVEYTVTLRKDTKRHECNCASWKPCYHINAMVAAENARWQAEHDAAKAVVEESKVVEATASLPEELCGNAKSLTVKGPALPRRMTRHEEDQAAKAKIAAKLGPVWESKLENAPLNGNRGFSLMR